MFWRKHLSSISKSVGRVMFSGDAPPPRVLNSRVEPQGRSRCHSISRDVADRGAPNNSNPTASADVTRIEELRPVKDKGKFCLGPDYRLDAGRCFALPVRASQQEVPPIVAGGAASHVGKVESVHVDELERVVTPFFNGRHREDERFRPEVRTQKRVWRIRIRSLDRLVVRRIDSSGVA
jgi:hypothetical protein